ncbi:MAG TPA: ABC transporter permease [Candidatus Acidoferrales bacterium]|nr:ABC transporter permease [Candidatus Acidoferrales bacterium]
MNLRRVAAMGRKELIQIRRDPRSLAIVVLLPLIQIVLLGYGARLDADHIPTCVYDQESSQDSQALLKRFQASRYFDVRKVVHDYRILVAAVDAGRCKLGLVIPWDFSRRVADAGHTAVQAVVDGTDNNSAQLAVGYAQAVVGAYASDVQLEWFAVHRLPRQAAAPLVVDYRTWFNEELESKNFIIPGTVALVMVLMGALLSSLTIAREWERGTMEGLIATPVTAAEIMIGKLLPYMLIGVFDALLCTMLAVGWFAVPFRGAIGTLLVVTIMFLTVILGIGYMISVATKSQVGASQYALLVTLMPTTMLSGFAFPVDQMPVPIQAVTYLVYSRYYVSALKKIYLAGSGVLDLWPQILALAIYASVIGLFATRAFRKSLQ